MAADLSTGRESVKKLALMAALAATPAQAQVAYPDHPIDLIVPFAPGGTSDVIARIAAQDMSAALGQSIVIENIGGAGGAVALAKAARAKPDGYTFVIGNAGTNAAVYWTTPDVQFSVESFDPVDRSAAILLGESFGRGEWWASSPLHVWTRRESRAALDEVTLRGDSGRKPSPP